MEDKNEMLTTLGMRFISYPIFETSTDYEKYKGGELRKKDIFLKEVLISISKQKKYCLHTHTRQIRNNKRIYKY